MLNRMEHHSSERTRGPIREPETELQNQKVQSHEHGLMSRVPESEAAGKRGGMWNMAEDL